MQKLLKMELSCRTGFQGRILIILSLISAVHSQRPRDACVEEVTTDAGDFYLNDETILMEDIAHNGNAVYIIRRPDQSHFFLDRVCFQANSSRVSIIQHDENNVKKVIVKFHRKQTDISFCLSDRQQLETSKITIKFEDAGFYVAGGVMVSGFVVCQTDQPGPTCGVSQYADAGLMGGTIPGASIVNGWEARPNEFPWQVMIIYHFGGCCCGGSVIDSNYILTAAHCVAGVTDLHELTVYVGEHDKFEIDDEYTVNVVDVTVHEEYNRSTVANDIALMRIDRGISEWTDSVFPVCMPTEPFSEHVGDTVLVSGWGVFVPGGTHSYAELQYTTVQLMSNDECRSCLPRIRDGMLCAGVCGINYQDACQNDSGGPLVRKKEDGSFELTGIVSWGRGCASDTPGVYADVYYYKEWILANAPGANISFG